MINYLFINFSISHYVEVLLNVESLQYCITKLGHKLWKYKERKSMVYTLLNINIHIKTWLLQCCVVDRVYVPVIYLGYVPVVCPGIGPGQVPVVSNILLNLQILAHLFQITIFMLGKIWKTRAKFCQTLAQVDQCLTSKPGQDYQVKVNYHLICAFPHPEPPLPRLSLKNGGVRKYVQNKSFSHKIW